MTDQDDVRRIAMALPGTTHEGDGYRVAGKQFAWTYPERVHPKKPRVPNPAVLCVRVAGEAEKQLLLHADLAKFFTTDHYNGYPAVMVRLSEVDAVELAELITDAWRTRAPSDEVRRFDAGSGD
jgi:hypothetical protein